MMVKRASIAYETALARSASGDYKGAIDQLNEEEIGTVAGYAALSQMQKANLAMKINDLKQLCSLSKKLPNMIPILSQSKNGPASGT